MLDHYTLTDPYGTFIGGNLPTVPTDRNRPGWNLQMNHNWTISNSLLNEVKFNYSGNNQSIDPVGDTWQRSSYGFQFPQIYPNGGTYEDSIPVGSISGFAGWQSASNALISPTKDFALTETLTWLKGAHTVKTGILAIYNTKKQNGRSQYAGNVSFNPSGNPNSTGNAFADALLGNFRSYSEAQLDPVGLFRFWQVEAFVTDGWRITPNFSVEAGLRYTYHYRDLHPGQQPHGLRPRHLRSGAGGHGQHQRHARARQREPLQRPPPPRRGAGRPEGRRPERGQPGRAVDSDRRQPRDLRAAAPAHAQVQLRLVARRLREDVRPRRDRPLLRPARG